MNTANTTPRPEYPRPQFTRADWMNLNGVWEFEVDASLSGEERDLHLGQPLSRKITVPFCPESELSGIGEKDFMPSVWYRRAIELPAGWNAPGKRVFLHFGACDYETTVWVNGSNVGFHRGGYTSFAFEITRAVVSGSNIIVVRANDDTRSKLQPTGKQSERLHSYSCLYTRTTGIWQTVWLEAVPETFVRSVKYYPNIDPDECVIVMGLPTNLHSRQEAALKHMAADCTDPDASWSCLSRLRLTTA